MPDVPRFALLSISQTNMAFRFMLMFPAPYWEWETVFNGYISNVCDLIRVFGFQLGIPLQDLFQYDSLGNAICPKKHLSNTTKARCVGCPVGDSCEYKGLLNK